MLREETLLVACLEALSPRLLTAHQTAKNNKFGLDVANLRDQRRIRTGSKRVSKIKRFGDPAELYKLGMGQVRSYLKHSLLEIAFRLFQAKCQEQLQINPRFLAVEFFKAPFIFPETEEIIATIFVQFGLLEPGDPLRITDYCLDLADQYIEEINNQNRTKWQNGFNQLQLELEKANKRVESAKEAVMAAKNEARKKTLKPRQYKQTKIDQYILPSEVEVPEVSPEARQL